MNVTQREVVFRCPTRVLLSNEQIRTESEMLERVNHFVCPAKYRRVVFDKKVDRTLVEIFLEIEKRYEIHFLEIGTDKDRVHFLLQSVPMKSPTSIVKMVKSLTAREIFMRHPEVKKILWGGAFWSSGYFVNMRKLYRNTCATKEWRRSTMFYIRSTC